MKIVIVLLVLFCVGFIVGCSEPTTIEAAAPDQVTPTSPAENVEQPAANNNLQPPALPED